MSRPHSAVRRRRKSKPGVQRGALRRNWHLFPRAFQYLRPYRRLAGVSVVLTVLLTLAALAEPWPLAFIVDTVLHDKPAPGWVVRLVGDGERAQIALGAAGILLVTLLSGLLRVVSEYVTTKVDLRMVLGLRSDLFWHIQRLSLAFHDDARTGNLMYRINDQADAVGKVVVALPDFAQSGLTLIGMLVIAFTIDPWMALLSLSVVPFVVWSTTHYANRIEPSLRRVRKLEATALSIVHEAITMVRVIVTFGREGYEYRRFRAQGEQAVNARVNLTVRQALFTLVVSTITAAGTATVLGVGAWQVMSGRISTGELLVILSYVAAVYGPLRTLTNAITSLQQQLMALESAITLLDTTPEVKEKPGAAAIHRVAGAIAFEDVGFSYPTRRDTLQSVSFSVQPGEAVALVGPTGAGKSTLVSLIPRFIDADRGRVTIDGVDVRDVTLESLRGQFSLVLQEPLLFSGSIRANIAYGRPGASDDEIENAARSANAHDFICRLPDAYETMLGERGVKISGGERQRIAVARAFLRDAPVLILDEPTSSIDSRTESVILDALDRLMAGRTTIVIAHRLATIRAVDKIVVLNEGKVVEFGTHEDLVAGDGLYRQLWEAQARQRQRVRAARQAIGQAAWPPPVLVGQLDDWPPPPLA